jgi:hypothetical protein
METKKARNCGDGRPLRDDRFRDWNLSTPSCISQAGVKIFFATAALMNYVIYDLDAINAFGQAGELFQLVHMEIDNQYRDWYLARKKEDDPRWLGSPRQRINPRSPRFGRSVAVKDQ